MNNKSPIHTIKIGRIRAAIWENESENGPWNSVTFSRLYKDETGGWKDSTSFSRDDLPLLMKVADQVHTYLYQKSPEQEVEIS